VTEHRLRRASAAAGGSDGAAAVGEEDLVAARRVREGVVRLARRLQAQRQDHGVSPTGIALLSRLNRDGEATPKALADAEDAQPQTLTRVIATLEEQGLVARRADPADGRQVLLTLTVTGLRLLQRHAATQIDWLAGAVAAELSEPEREIVRIAATLLDRLADHRP
jgi:DNA-binding MarR family transcriptional regulator